MDKRNGNNERNRDNERSRRRQIERDGVIYTPSYSEDLEKTQVISSKDVIKKIPANTQYTKKVPSRRRGTKSKDKKTGVALFYITTIFVGVIACVFIFAAFYNTLMNNGDKPSNTPNSSVGATDEPDTTIVDDGLTVTMVGIVSKVNSDNKSMDVLNTETGNADTVFVDGATELKDKFGSSLVFEEFKIGDIVDIQYKKSGKTLLHLKISPQYWEHTEVSKVKVNTETKTISYGSDKYNYDDNLIALYKDEEYAVSELSELSDIDLVTVRGYKDKALYVNVLKKHGTIVLEENKDILNGTVEIDTSDFIALEAREIKVLEGRHKIVVNGANIQTFTDEITVDPGEKYKLNLADIVFKGGIVSFKINEPDATLTINGEAYNHSEPVVLEYGEYAVVVEKEGFDKHEETIVLETATREIEVKLEKTMEISEFTISTDPEGARIYIDDQYVGISPVTVSVTYGSHMVTVNKEGYIVVDIPFDISVDAIYRTVTLQALSGETYPY